ncbi:hypothetical protein NKH52_27920 [Mesorhizobium sp. M1066]|uniref:hypothetical protein n=1 Tax=unclassified Mesorhizobium TaxID=325217 RepID=UPI0033360CCB
MPIADMARAANPMQTVFSFMVSPPSCFLHQPATDFAILVGAADKLIPVPIRLVNLGQGASGGFEAVISLPFCGYRSFRASGTDFCFVHAITPDRFAFSDVQILDIG